MNNNTSPVVAKKTTTSLSTTTTPEKQKAKIPLKTILKNFLNHVDFMEGQRKEGEDLYEKEYSEFKMLLLSERVFHIFGGAWPFFYVRVVMTI